MFYNKDSFAEVSLYQLFLYFAKALNPKDDLDIAEMMRCTYM
ncbi:hypothetical protein HMPREF3226_01814 [Prevotella corporis]|uniref:Uncharacterized protein n=1 Tax=Prevotella corporis TaxID=28128 RepID=A0A133Q1X1_9BACT|nr:hypothetical protein HMPREF3226_01814 [Prevotella corporis]